MIEMDALSDLKKSTEDIDYQILELLAKRKELEIREADAKYRAGLPARDPEGIRLAVQRLTDLGLGMGLSADFVSGVFRNIYAGAVTRQISRMLGNVGSAKGPGREIRVSFLGKAGTYSYLAAYRYFNAVCDYIRPKNCGSFDEIIGAVEKGECDCGVLPIENTSSGCINEVYDLLQKSTVKIVGELNYPIEHAILARGNADLSGIRALYAHPQPFSQCSEWLRLNLPDAELRACSSSSEAMETVRNLDRADCAAIGCAEAGALYSLTPIRRDIANHKRNVTRFIVIGMSYITVPEGVEAKTSLTFTTTNTPGSLVKVLNVFSSRGVNMVKLQSRPRIGGSGDDPADIWGETFYADIIVNRSSRLMTELLDDLDKVTGSVRILGCYATGGFMEKLRQRPAE